MRPFATLGAACLLGNAASALQVDLESPDSIRNTASTMAHGLMSFYTGNNTGDVPGNLPDPYFWWTAGAMFGAMVDYWAMTGDETYNEVTMQAMLHQTGDENDFMPGNQTATLGNDDQGFWALAAMSAAETKFEDPPEDEPQWLALTQACFNQWASRWDEESCGGGIRWQIFTFNNGFNYKNSISNGIFFNIAARLARFTGNETYADWATKVWDWEVESGLITRDYQVFDGLGVEQGSDRCPDVDENQWSYNAGVFLYGAAVMANFTGEERWTTRMNGLLDQTESHFFEDGNIIVEQRCEPFGFCNEDQQTFKGYLIRWMSATAQVVPETYDRIMDLLRPNAVAAAASCVGSPQEGFPGMDGTACGLQWTVDGFDNKPGVGEQMNAMSAVMYMLAEKEEAAPVTADTGGTSRGDPDAGMEPHHYPWELPEITINDQVAAGFATSGIALSVLAACIWMIKE